MATLVSFEPHGATFAGTSADNHAVPRAATWAATLVVAATIIGFALRVLCARGGLWLDEAWSAIAAHDVATPAGVFLNINHDNNHHLNTLWLQLVGMDAPSIVQRGLSIMTGTLAIPVAASLAVRRGACVQVVTAFLFATSPILVTLGSEARGYAPMVLALLGAIGAVDRALDGDAAEQRTRLALCVGLGLLSQMTMIFGLVATGGWAFVEWTRRHGAAEATRRTAALFAPALAAAAAVLSLFAFAAWHSETGFHLGSFEPFRWLAWLKAQIELIGFTIGYPILTPALVVGACALVILAPRLVGERVWLYRVAILAFPAGLALVHTANPGHARYYLLAGIALLLLVGEFIGAGLARSGRARWVATAAGAAFLVGAGVQDATLARNLRADPLIAIDALQAHAPGGASIWYDRETGAGVLRVAAAQRHYPLTTEAHCPRFAFVDRFGGEIMPPRVRRCGADYLPIAARRVNGMSGTHWTLYERVP